MSRPAPTFRGQPPSRSLTRPAAAVLLAAGLIAPAVLAQPAAAVPAAAGVTAAGVIDLPVDSADDVDVRFAAVGDIHDQWGELTEAYEFWAEQDVQAALLVGDLTDSATQSEYNGLRDTLAANAVTGIPAITSMGNHDVSGIGSYDRFTAATGQQPNAHYTVQGYHVITVSPGAGSLDAGTGLPSLPSSGDYAYSKDWLRAQLTEATADDPTKPVMVMVHHPLRCTHYVSDEWYGTGLADGCGDDFASIFDDFPQAIVWGGHIHTPQNTPTSIWQGQKGRSDAAADKGFTSVNAPPLVYYEFESGVINTSPTSRSTDTTPDDAGDNRQTAIVEISGSVVTVKNYDLLADEWIAQTWTWDVADSVDTSQSYDERFPFNNEYRSAQTAGPVWGSDAAITVDAITGSKAMVSFPQAAAAPNTVGDIVHKYRYSTIDVATGDEVNSFQQWSGFYNLPFPTDRAHEVWNLQPEHDYEVRITPINAWGLEGEALTARFRTADYAPGEKPFDPTELEFDDLVGDVPAADLLDLAIVDGEPVDVSESARELTAGADSSIVADDELAADVLVGAEGGQTAVRTDIFTDDDYAALQDGFTLNTTFRLDSIDSGYIDVFGGMQSGGIGLEAVGLSASTYELQFWYASPRPTVTLEYGEWYHVTAVYDGTGARLYVDGAEKAESESVSFNVKPSSAAARYMTIGGDANPSGSLDDATMTGRIAGTQLYSEVLDEANVHRVAVRELPLIDTIAPMLRLPEKPVTTATVGERVALPAAEAVDDSGVVETAVVVTGPDGESVATDDAGASVAARVAIAASGFTPTVVGDYTVAYIATDGAGLQARYEQTIAVAAAAGGSDGGSDGGSGSGSDGGPGSNDGTDAGAGSAASDDALATTGGAMAPWMLLLAVGALTAGAVLVTLRARRRATRE